MKRAIFLFCLFWLSLSYWQPTFGTFDTIDKTRSYIDSIEEYPELQMRDWSNPDYTPYYKQTHAGFFSRLLERTGMYKPLFSPLQAKKLLKSITRDRELNGLTGRFVQKITPSQGEKILIFGDLSGAVHSFVRDLEYLKTINVLSNNFKLKEGYYIIINGNAADKSHHILELLAIIIRLLHENPKTVFYVRGIPEDKEGWLGKTLEHELVVRAAHISNGRVPLELELDRFFNTLPVAVFVTMTVNDKVQCIRFSQEGFSNKELRSEAIDTFLQSEVKQSQYKLNETLVSDKKREKKIDLIALFRLEDRAKTYRKSKGIVHLDDEEGIPAFATLSGPVETNRRLYDFFYDAFLEISIGTDLASSSLTLFFRDVREMIGFQQETVPFLSKTFSTQEPKKQEMVSKEEKEAEKKELVPETSATTSPRPPVTPQVEKSENKKGSTDSSGRKKSIQLGCTLDMSRGLLRVAGQYRRGIEVSAKRYEQQEGMDIQITFLDDQYTPEMARSNVEILLSKNIDILLGPTGSPTTESYLDLIREKRVLVLFPITGASLFRSPQLPYIIHFRASYELEAQILMHEAINTHNAKKVTLFYQDDSFGHAALAGIEEYRKKMNLPSDFIVKVPYERNNVNFTTQADAIKKANSQVIILVTVISAARELLRLFDMSFFEGKTVLGVSDLSERTFINFSKEKGINIQTLSVTPNPLSNLEIAKRFREDAAAENLELDTFSFEGYIDGTICFDALKKIKGDKATKESIREVITSYKDYHLFGLILTFNPERQDLSQGTWWVSDEKEWRVAKIPEIVQQKQPQEPKKEDTQTPTPEQKQEVPPQQDKQSTEKKQEAQQPPLDKQIAEKKQELQPQQDKLATEKKKETELPQDKQTPEKKQESQPQQPQEKQVVEKKTPSSQEQKKIRVGCSMDLSRGLRIANEQQQEGMKMALARFEKDVPLSIQFVFLDDQYSPPIALENAKKFLDQGIDIILGSSGSPTTQTFLDLCKEGKLLVLFPTSGAPVLRSSEYRYMLHFRPCVCTEAKAMIREAITNGAKNIVVFYQDDSFGRGALTGIERYEKENDIKQVALTKIPYNRNDVNFTQQAEQMKKVNPDTFIFLSTAFAAREIVRLIDISFFYERKIFGISDLAEEAFLKFMKEKGITMTVTNVMPDIHADIEIAKMFLADTKKNSFPADALAFEGYVITALFCDILKHVDLSKNLKDEIVRVVESYKQHPFFGLTLTFNPTMRDLSQPVWLFNGTTWKEVKF